SRFGFDGRTDRLVGELAAVGYRPADVTIVILTHLHADHVGGATRWDTPDHRPGTVVPTFPNARYIAQRIDLAEASFPNERTQATFHSHNWLPLLAREQLQVVDGPQQVANGVRTDIAPGHTAALQMVWVEDGGESLLFLGDACSWASHMDRLAWVPAFDLYPQTSIETKRR
ncbi:MAG: MBL fold metallo-hydrolase, partial [Caldilineaceae bacterium]|nr:MBL fold metallo-hydrolase [Caldilineaceae bacterium]